MTRALRLQASSEVQCFIDQKQTASARWTYCASRMAHRVTLRSGRVVMDIRASDGACRRILNYSTAGGSVLRQKLLRVREHGFEAANDFYAARLIVGPLEPWNVGHVYFFRPDDYPHVLKVGFSRRIFDRLEEIEAEAGCRSSIDRAYAGTVLDEQWWHRNWRDFRIQGEWFFNPYSPERSIPKFLAAEPA